MEQESTATRSQFKPIGTLVSGDSCLEACQVVMEQESAATRGELDISYCYNYMPSPGMITSMFVICDNKYGSLIISELDISYCYNYMSSPVIITSVCDL
ncbi:hypothetical protein J6590_098447 [Homalodisca vitripennis]|nr:hypothetical protein J6590_098447 [Homalodisca vitripennis]